MYFRIGTIHENYLYFFSCNNGLLYRMDLENGVIEALGSRAMCIYGKKDAIGCMITYQDQIYTTSNDGNYLVVYDPISEAIDEYFIACNSADWGNIAGIFGYKKSIFVIPTIQKKIVVLDCTTGEIQSIRLQIKEDEKIIRCLNLNTQVWLFTGSGQFVYLLDLEDYSIKSIHCRIPIRNVHRIGRVDGNNYFLTAQGEIYQWEIYGGENRLLAKYKDPVRCVGFVEYYAIFPPFYSNTIKILDLRNYRTTEIKNFPSDYKHYDINQWGAYHNMCEDDNYIYFVGMTNYLIAVSKKDCSINWIHILFDSKNQNEYMSNWLRQDLNNKMSDKPIFEADLYELESFVKAII